MKKILFILVVSVTLLGCDDKKSVQSINDSPQPDVAECIVVLDSCEYIKQNTYIYTIYTHKGNCKFCEQRRKDEISKLVTNKI